METKQNKKPWKKAPQWIFFYYYFITLFIPNDVFALKSTFPPDINITILVLLVLLVASGKTKKTFNAWVLLSLGMSVRFAPLISHSGVSVRFKVCATGRGFFFIKAMKIKVHHICPQGKAGFIATLTSLVSNFPLAFGLTIPCDVIKIFWRMK